MNKDNRRIIGMDLGDSKSELCVVNSDGEVLLRRSVTTRASSLRTVFREPGARVVIEASTHSPWVSRLLEELEHEVVIVNPRRMRMIADSLKKTDRADAQVLATMGRLGGQELWTIQHRSARAQADLAVVRSRAVLVKTRTLLVNHVRSMVKGVGTTLTSCDADNFGMERMAEALPAELRPSLLPLLAHIDQVTAQIHAYDREISKLCEQHYPETKLLLQVNGVGPITALTYILTLDRPERFRKSREVGPYLGLTPGQRQSGAQDHQLRISKAGDKTLRSLLVQCAQHILGARGKDSNLRRWGLARIQAGNARDKRRVIVAVARKLAVLLHHLWSSGECYDPFYGKTVEEVIGA